MKARFALVAALLATTSLTTHAADIIRFSPGVDGETKISTPWGDYAAYQQGSTIWVGTADEFERNRVKGIMADQGLKEFKASGAGNVFIERDLPTVTVGQTSVASISPFILFGEGANKKMNRPAKPAGHEYVSIMWLQDSKQNITTAIYDQADYTVYRPFTCRVTAGWHACETIMPTTVLNHPVYLSFTASKQKPAVVPLASIAVGQYSNYLVQRRGMGAIPPSQEDLADQRNMHLVDARIPQP